MVLIKGSESNHLGTIVEDSLERSTPIGGTAAENGRATTGHRPQVVVGLVAGA
jgi:hypothetical protein